MKKKFIYDKYANNIQFEMKKQRIAETGSIQTVLVMESLKNNKSKNEIILGSLKNSQDFSEESLQDIIGGILENGQITQNINKLISDKNKKGVDENFSRLYNNLKNAEFWFTDEGYRITNSDSKNKMDAITVDDLTVNFCDDVKGPIVSKYELFKVGELYENNELK